MGWLWWLASPVLATATVAAWVWWRGRPARSPSIEQAMRRHEGFLAALVVPARGTTRTEPAEVQD